MQALRQLLFLLLLLLCLLAVLALDPAFGRIVRHLFGSLGFSKKLSDAGDGAFPAVLWCAIAWRQIAKGRARLEKRQKWRG